MAETKHTFQTGLPNVVLAKEPLKYPCIGKLTIERQVDYAGTWPNDKPKPSVTGD